MFQQIKRKIFGVVAPPTLAGSAIACDEKPSTNDEVIEFVNELRKRALEANGNPYVAVFVPWKVEADGVQWYRCYRNRVPLYV
tara:strand:- start:154991 stop:155239 length:249 start_codon:yes stop_codon:yes gene_type:complete